MFRALLVTCLCVHYVSVSAQEVLLLKEQHLKEMALMASALSPKNAGSGEAAAGGAGGAGRTGGPADANKHLLAQLEAMRQEQRRAVEQVPVNPPGNASASPVGAHIQAHQPPSPPSSRCPLARLEELTHALQALTSRHTNPLPRGGRHAGEHTRRTDCLDGAPPSPWASLSPTRPPATPTSSPVPCVRPLPPPRAARRGASAAAGRG